MTDVEDLHKWIVSHMTQHPLYEQLSLDEAVSKENYPILPIDISSTQPLDSLQNADPITPQLYHSSEEGAKVVRNSGEHFLAIFRRN